MQRIIRQSDRGRHPIAEATGLSVQSIHRLERAGKFPSRLQLGPGAVGWLAEDVETWIRTRARGPLPAPQIKPDARG